MKLLSVGLTGENSDMITRLQHDCSRLIPDGFRIAVDEINKGKYTFIGCNIIEGELSFRNYERLKESLKLYVAKLVTDIILNREEKKMIRRLIAQHYHYFSVEEQENIFAYSQKIIEGNMNIFQESGVHDRRKHVMNRVLEHLDYQHELVVEGFVRFRLKDYQHSLRQLVDIAVDEFMMDLEYKEFIGVLRHFVTVQEKAVLESHVVIHTAKSYQILDSEGKPLSNQYLAHIAAPYNNAISYEDLLITALIAISPFHIIIHNPSSVEASEVIETVRGVFENRVMMCGGCELCLADTSCTVDRD